MKKIAVVFSFLVLTSAGVSAATPTPDQIRLFQSLPADQQSQLIKQFQSGAQPQTSLGAPLGTTVPPAQSFDNPSDVRPRAPAPTPSNNRVEQALNNYAVEELKQFGYDLFNNDSSSFAPNADVAVPTDYVLGPGDNVQVQLFGMENSSFNLVVSRDGTLNFPGIGVIPVSGMSFDQAKSAINTRLSKQYIGVQSNITMGGLRSIRVFVLGDVVRPGSYTVSSLSTMTNALFMSGGIKQIGSLRKIQLKRGGKLITTLDLYDLLMRGDTTADSRLKPGDVIFVPPIGATVGVAGAVVRPAIYELRNEKNVSELVRYAGGLMASADPGAARLERINNKRQRTVIDLDLNKASSGMRGLETGDIINIPSVLDRRDNIVELAGHVRRPGVVQWRKGMRLTDVIPSHDVLFADSDTHYVLVQREMPLSRKLQVKGVDLQAALANRASTDNIVLEPRDQVVVLSLDEKRKSEIAKITEALVKQGSLAQADQLVSVEGHVRFPGKYPYFSGMRVADLLRAAVDLAPGADMHYALVRREVGPERRVEVLSIIPERVLSQSGGEFNLELQPRDVLYLFSDTPDADDARAVAQLVEKRADVAHSDEAGNLPSGVSADDVSLDTIVKTGQLGANLPGVLSVDSKVSSRMQMVSRLVESLRKQADLATPTAVVSVNGNVRFPGDYPLTRGMTVVDLLRAGGRLADSAFLNKAELVRYTVVDNELRQAQVIAIDLADVLKGGTSNLGLQPYDKLNVMEITMWAQDLTVEIKGEVKHPGKYTMRQGETLSQLLLRAGGVTTMSYPEAAFFTREELKKKEQQGINDMIKRLRADMAAMPIEQMKGDPDKAQAFAMSKELLDQLESVVATGRLVIDLPSILEGKEESDVLLKAGDTLVVPSFRQEISVLGEVFYPTSHLYDSGVSVKGYVNRSGGMTKRADDDRIYVVRANGAVVKADPGWFSPTVSLKPGDTVVVPMDTDRINKLRLWTSVTQIVYQTAIAFASMKTIGVFK